MEIIRVHKMSTIRVVQMMSFIRVKMISIS